MDEPEKKEQNLRMAELKPSVLLAGNSPRLIDEWQSAPTLWDSIRFSALMHFKVINGKLGLPVCRLFELEDINMCVRSNSVTVPFSL